MRSAVLLALVLVAPFALANGTLDVPDGESDQRALMTQPALIDSPVCHDWAIEVTGARVVNDGTNVTWSFEVRDPAALPECAAGPVQLAPLQRTALGYSFHMLDFATGQGLIGSAFTSGSSRVFCAYLGSPGPNGSIIGNTIGCETRSLSAPLSWSAPLEGKATRNNGSPMSYDLRGVTLPTSNAGANSQANGPQGTRYQFSDSTDTFSVTL